MKRAPGFTLIELVLALGLTAILATTLGGVLRGAVGTWRDMRDSSRARQRAQALFNRLGEDLRNSISFPGESFIGTGGELVFKTVVDVAREPGSLETQPQIARVRYHQEFDEVSDLSLPGGPRVVREQKIYTTSIFSDARKTRVEIPATIHFAFAYAGGSVGEVLWEDVWIASDTVPGGVKASLVFQSKKGPLQYESGFRIPTGVFPPWNE
ncbi:MAG: type II secretion system protein [Elusimicrobia bacterium]|nr:type II secretion system protein [Elusimicrobiota bacterium]